MKKIIYLLTLIFFNISYADVVEQPGEACHSDINQAKEKALKDAKIKGVEKYVGTLVNTKTLIINGSLVRDIIQARALGSLKLIDKPQIIEKRVSPDDNVCIKLKAKFEILGKNFQPTNFGLILLLNKKEFIPEENLYIKISSEKPCYPYIFSVDSKQRVYLLLPNPIENTFLLKDKYTFPSKKMIFQGFELSIYPLPEVKLPQHEEVIFVCTKEKVKAFEKYFASAFATNEEKLKRLLKRPYTETVNIFNEIISQIGIENFDIISDSYTIYNSKNRK